MDNTPVINNDQVTIETPPLYLPIPHATLLAVLNEAEMRADQDYQTTGVATRGKENVEFWLGNQVDQNKLDSRFQMAHVDNVVHENLENQIKLASGKMPDIFCSPPDGEDYNLEIARDMQEWIRERIDTNTIKRLIKNGLRKMNLDFLAIIKPRWDYTQNDFVFDLLQTSDVRFSQGAKIVEDGFTIDGTDITFQYLEEPTAVVLAKFKKTADALRAEIALATKVTELPARLRYTEVHFRWYDQQGRLNEGVTWRYSNLILDAMKEPYYDYDNPAINYFDRPRKPYILFSYLNLGKSVYEATTAFEQGKSINRIINKRRRQITEISDRAVPKMAFSGKALTKEQARNISPSPNEGILMSDEVDDVRKGIFIIPATPPDPVLYNDMIDLRGRVNSVFATQGSNNASQAASASGISKQISREGDLVTSDDIVDIVVERVVSEMAQWAMQFARLFYDDDRDPLRLTNEEGDTKFVELTRNKIETDIQITVKASTNDKTTRRADALQMLTGKITDPYTLFEDLEVPNPKERTKRLMSFMMAQQSGDWTKYLEIIGVDLDTDKANQADAERDIELIVNGGTPNKKTNPTEAYVSTWIAFVNDPAQFEALDQTVKANIGQFVQDLKANIAKKLEGGEGEPAAPPPGAAGAIAGAPGVTQSAGYQPQVDASTVFNNNPQQPKVQFPATTATQPGVA